MLKERRDPQRSDRKAGLGIDMIVIVINIPDDVRVGDKVDLTVIKCGYAGEDNGRTVSLDSFAVEIVSEIVMEICYRDLLIRIITGKIDSYERYELDLRVLVKDLGNVLNLMKLRGDNA